MALKIWLPLNRDVKNYGLERVNVTGGNGLVFDNNGQFNGCYFFNQKIITIEPCEIGDDFTACFWAKYSSLEYPKTHVGIQHSAGAYTGGNIGWDIGHGPSGGGTVNLDINDGIHTQRMPFTGTGLNVLDVWNHFCIVCSLSERKVKFYFNGELSDKKDISSSISTFKTERITNIGGLYGWYFNGYLNDLRIYDNCLLEDDIKRIYQQKLFEFYPKECKKNLISNTNVKGEYGWSSYGFGSKGIGEVTDEVVPLRTTNMLNIRNGSTDNVIKITTKYSGETTSASEIARSISAKKISDNEFMTFSFYAKGEGTSVGRVIRSHVYCAKYGDSSTVLSTGTDYRLTSEWKRYAHAFKWTKGGTTTGNYSCYMVPYLAKNEHAYVCNFQFEEGSGTTEYNNSTNERNLIFEKSGFLIKNDLVCSGVTFSGNSAVFNGSSDIIRSKTNGLNISGGTLSIWFLPKVKPSGNGTVMFLDGNSRMAVGLYNNADYFIVSTKIAVNLFPASDVVYGSWNHICVLYGNDRVATNCYLNGTKLTPNSSTSNWSETESVMKIGARELYDSYFNGEIKNIKIFKKQLSEEEILELYNQNGN